MVCLFSAPSPWTMPPSGPLTCTTVLAPGRTLPLAGCLLMSSSISVPSSSRHVCRSLSPLFPIFISLFADWLFTRKQVLAETFHVWIFRIFSIRKAKVTFSFILSSEVWSFSSFPCSWGEFSVLLPFHNRLELCSMKTSRNALPKTQILPATRQMSERYVRKGNSQEPLALVVWGALIIWNSKASLFYLPVGSKK